MHYTTILNMLNLGGIPLRANGTVIGAIGVSGGTPNQDHQVAQAGLKAL